MSPMFTRSIACVILLFTGAGACTGADHNTGKVAMLRNVDAIYQQSLDLADRCSRRLCDSGRDFDDKAVRDSVFDLVARIEEPAVLFRLVIMSDATRYPGEAGFDRVDDPFYAARDASLARLRKIGTPDALDALRSIKWTLRLDGGDSPAVHEAIEQPERDLAKK